MSNSETGEGQANSPLGYSPCVSLSSHKVDNLSTYEQVSNSETGMENRRHRAHGEVITDIKPRLKT